MATTLIFNSTFETGTLAQQGWDEVNSGSADSSIIVASNDGITAHGGVDVAKQVNTSGSGEAGTRLQFYGMNYEQDFIIEWYDYYPSVMTYTVSGGNWGPQLFGIASTDINGVNGPVWSFGPKLVGGVMKAELVWKPSGWAPIGNGPLSTDDSSTKWYTSDVTMPTGQWVKWRIEVRPSGNFTGYLRWYMNDTLLWEFENCKTTVPDSGQRALYGDWVMMYTQHTMYGQGVTPQPCIRYLDDVSFWAVDRYGINQATTTEIAQPFGLGTVHTPVLKGYRWYNDDGDQANATPAAGENQPAIITPSTQLHLRLLVQEEGGVSSGTATWGLRHSRNGAAYSSVSASSIWVAAVDSTHLTDQEATTKRLSGGTGTFTAGKVDDVSGAVTGLVLPANNHLENVYSLGILGTSVLVDGDTVTFLLAQGGITFANEVTPTLTFSDNASTLVALNQAADAETAGAFSKAKAKSFAAAVDAETGQHFTVFENVVALAGAVAETEIAQAFSKLKLKGFSQSVATELAQPFTISAVGFSLGQPFRTPYNAFNGFQFNFEVPGTDFHPSFRGISVTPGINNTKGSWVNVFGGTTSVTEQTFGIWIHVHGGVTEGVSRPMLMDIGIDYDPPDLAYEVLVPNINVNSPRNIGGAHHEAWSYYFPIYIQQGRTIAVRAATSHASNATPFRVMVMLMHKPTHIDNVQVGSTVHTVGVDEPFSDGILFTPGNTVYGSWTLLGQATRDAWYVIPSVAAHDNDMVNVNVYADIGLSDDTAGTNRRTIISKARFGQSADEGCSNELIPHEMCFATVKAGQYLWIRGACSAAPNSNVYGMVHLVGD